MARSSWNKNTPDVVGLEFLGVGVVSNLVKAETDMRAVRFKAQSTGELDQVAVFAGPQTNNSVLTQSFFLGHRQPFIVDLYPASGFDIGPTYLEDTYAAAITTSSGVLDSDGTAPDGNELAAQFDNQYLVANGVPSVTCQMTGADTFPSGRRVSSIRINLGIYRPMNVQRIDNTGNWQGWQRLLGAGGGFHGELRIEDGTSVWTAWTVANIRQFSALSGNRRLRLAGLDAQANILDYLSITVFSTPEKRVGTAIIEPTANYQWTLADLVVPGTSTPANVISGQEYILLVRTPGGMEDYGSGRHLDASGLKDRRPNGTFVHFTDLDWDSHLVTQAGPQLQTALGDLIDGLPSVRLINNNAQTVNTQPYQTTIPMVPFKTSQGPLYPIRQNLDVPAGTTEYNAIRVNTALVRTVPTAPADVKSVVVEVVNNADTLIAGPFHITEDVWDAAPPVGNNLYGDPVHAVTLNFGAGIDIDHTGGVNAKMYLHADYVGTNIWRVEALLSDLSPVSGSDQTSFGTATGFGFVPPSNPLVSFPTADRRADVQVSLLSQPPEIAGIGVIELQQPVTGGQCEPCETDGTYASNCTTTYIPYNQVCWPATTLTYAKFKHYELQRQEAEVSAEWVTIAVIAPTGTPATGAPATGVPHCFDDWTASWDTEVCYRVRQARNDGAVSDFVDEACITTASPPGADLVVIAPDDPDLNVAFSEAHGDRLPIEREWRNLDATQVEFRPIYGRDKYLAFRPSERLGLQFTRTLLVNALCTPNPPCLNVAAGLRAIATTPTSILVVKDDCGNRWYADVAVNSINHISDPAGIDVWRAEVTVTELATPVVAVP